MNRRGLVASLFGIILIAVVALSATLIAGRSPLLGLDLSGGVEVVLQPQTKVKPAVLQTAVNIIDERVNKLGVANSTVQRQGNDVVVELPGIKNQQSALQTLGETAQLFFRPVICNILPYSPPAKSTTTTTTPKSTATTAPATTTPTSSATTTKGALGATTPARLTSVVVGSSSSTTTATSSATTSPTTSKSSSTTTKSAATTTPATTTPATTTPTTTTPTTTPAAKSTDPDASLQKACSAADSSSIKSTNPNADTPKRTVIIPSAPGTGQGPDRWVLGPADLTGTIVKSASVTTVSQNSSELAVSVTLTSSGLNAFNKIAVIRHQYYSATATSQSPLSLEAIDLDGQVESAPTIESAPFTGSLQITGSFTSTQANDLATVLQYGSLPVKFTPSSINTLSATLGHSSLEAGLFAGLGGVVLVLLYMILYYRALGLVVVLGLGVGGALLYSILTELSYTSSLALTLSGITGVIVSIGITVDSYVVYFERLKDEVRSGKTVRSSVERGFSRAFRTVLTADLVSFMAALILYLFTVGDVRGFAFTLGLSTLLDVFTAYFFIRPIVVLLGRRRTTSETRFLGIARGLGAATQVPR